MSITIWCAGAPGTYKDNVYGKGTHYEETVTEWITETPEVNMSNDNAAAVLEMLGLDPECGTLLVEGIPNVRRRIVELLNRQGATEHAHDPGFDVGGPGTGHCRVLQMPREASYFQSVLPRIDAVLAAQAGGYEVSWG